MWASLLLRNLSSFIWISVTNCNSLIFIKNCIEYNLTFQQSPLWIDSAYSTAMINTYREYKSDRED